MAFSSPNAWWRKKKLQPIGYPAKCLPYPRASGPGAPLRKQRHDTVVLILYGHPRSIDELWAWQEGSSRCGDAPWQQFVDAINREICNAAEHVPQVPTGPC